MQNHLGSRQAAVREVISRGVRKFDLIKDEKGNELKVSEYYGINTFNLALMRSKLPKEVYAKLLATIHSGSKLDSDVANTVATAVKEWALSRGVTHFCHWFQPQTGSTAEKHDAFVSFDDQNLPIESFSGGQLIQSEPDASSFPSGGMRTTFEARGYTAWDPTSPMFIIESRNSKTLCIPSAFISYYGDALDEKTGLIRSMEALSEKATALLQTIGDKGVKRVLPTLGPEQEYFLIDRAFYSLRPDLIMSGRTLLGSQPPRGQQLEDHYFGSIPARVQAFMNEAEQELYKLGIPVKTRHNEVAPSQYECAPIFEEANIANDHNQLVMEVFRKVAKRHSFEALFHEKPFAGLNGSGKHCNWSMMITGSGSDWDGKNLLDPGKTPQQNLRFLLFLVATLKGVHKHHGLLRAGIASAGNDHRLGANEAPPAIISVFLGHMLNKILDEIETGNPKDLKNEEGLLKLGVSKLPEIMKDNTDRNRTSPFAFTGNKFEFRAVGSSSTVAFPVTLLNAVVADGISEINQRLKSKLQNEKSLEVAALSVLKEVVKETKNVRFEGNNYSEEWVKEANVRGLLNLKKTPESLEQLVTSSAKKLLTELKIFNEAEIVSRFHIRNESYIKKMLIETSTLTSMIDTMILPASFAYHEFLAKSVNAAKTAGVSTPQLEVLKSLTTLIGALQSKNESLVSSLAKLDSMKSDEEKAKFLSTQIAPLTEEVRTNCDKIEEMIADHYWPLPKYREMLFII